MTQDRLAEELAVSVKYLQRVQAEQENLTLRPSCASPTEDEKPGIGQWDV